MRGSGELEDDEGEEDDEEGSAEGKRCVGVVENARRGKSGEERMSGTKLDRKDIF